MVSDPAKGDACLSGPGPTHPDDALTREIIGASMDVHKALGPGLLESVYEQCLVIACEARGLRVQRQVEVPIEFLGQRIQPGYRVDVLVNESVIVEVKAVERVLPVHEAQLLTYLRLTGKEVGLLLNFNTAYMRDGVVRRVLSRNGGAAPETLRASAPRR